MNTTIQTPMPATFPTASGPVPLFDKRDGARDAHLQFKTFSEMLSIPWNAWCGHSMSGAGYGEYGTAHLARLVRDAEKTGKRVLACDVNNYGCGIAVSTRST